MRAVLVIACVVAFAFSAWSNMPSSADSKQSTVTSISPLTTTSTVTNLKSAQYLY